ncbi:MAG: hypothetical protein HY313_00815 [Acidobacteria bacterium]|nr:hypothetical protein [Acidobacteriota bacterium]
MFSRFSLKNLLALLTMILFIGVPAQAQTTVDASRGGVTISSGNNSLTLGARAQFRWTVDDREQFDADTTGSGLGMEDGAASSFDIPRLRITLSGGYESWLKYSFQFEMSRTSGDGGSRIKDAIIEIRPANPHYRIVMGQFKAPFGLQQFTSSGRQQFVDRAITDGKFTPGRDMGVMLSGTAASQKLGYAIGIFNGAGESRLQNNQNHLVTGRVFVNPLGAYSLSEGSGDVNGSVLHLGFGALTGTQIRGRTAAGVFQNPDNQTAYDVEFAFKAPWIFSTAEYFWMTDEQQNPVAGPDIESQGYHAQIGFMVVPRIVELGVRYAQVDGDRDVDDSTLSEIRGVLGYYWHGHNAKIQADVGKLLYDSAFATLSSRARSGLPRLGTRLVSGQSLSDTQFRLQFQVAF